MVLNTRRYLPDAELRCICTGPDDTARRYSIQPFPCSSHHAKGYSAVSATKPRRAVGLLRALLQRVPNESRYALLNWSLIAKLCGCRLLFASARGEPMYHPMTEWLVRAALWLADYRSYRDLYSKRFIEGIGFKTRGDRLYPDLAFSLPRALFPECSPKKAHAKTVAIGVKDYCGKLSIPHRTGKAKISGFYRQTSDVCGLTSSRQSRRPASCR
jgi:polysaccharide pyruvyl transferase WcaK-like protein